LSLDKFKIPLGPWVIVVEAVSKGVSGPFIPALKDEFIAPFHRAELPRCK